MAHTGTAMETTTRDRLWDTQHLTKIEGQQALPPRKIQEFLEDLKWEMNDWRFVADREADYYDSKQLDSEVLKLMEERGIPPLMRNVIAPTIDTILGMEAKNRRDVKVVAVDETKEAKITAEALNTKFNEAQRLTRFARACSDAYKSQIITGIGWVKIGRPLDPFKGLYEARAVHRREMFWDWRGTAMDLDDARYVVRKKWYDKDVLKAVFPKKADVIDAAGNMWAAWDSDAYTSGSPYYTAQLHTAYGQFTSAALDAIEWLDTERDRMALYEVWYRVYERGRVLRHGSKVWEYDPDNPLHDMALKKGAILEHCVLSRVRLAYWVGPHLIYDMPSPYPHNRFPYVPFWGMKEDRTGQPYGLVRRMMSPQDEVNARLSRMMWLLSAKRVMGDTDAFAMGEDEVMDEVSRADAFIALNPERINRQEKPEITTDHGLANQQFEVMVDASHYVKEVAAGTYASFQGQDDQGVKSGRAIQQLIDQTSTTLSEINDNYGLGKELAGEQLLSLVKQDVMDGETVQITRHGKRMSVALNNPMVDPDTGMPYRANNIVNIRTRVEQEEVPKTSSYRQQQYVQLLELTKSLDPEIQKLVIDILIKASDLADRDEIVDRLQRHLGIGEPEDGDMDPEMQAKRQREAEMSKLEMETLHAEVKQKMAEAEKTEAEVKETLATIEKLRAEVEKIAAEIGREELTTAIEVDRNSRERQSATVQDQKTAAETEATKKQASADSAGKKPKKSKKRAA